MSGFKVWLEFQSQKNAELKQIWQDVFKALQLGAIAKSDVVSYSLDKATEGLKRKSPAGTIILNELKPIFDRLQRLDPNFSKNIEDVTQWLGQSQIGDEKATAPQRTLGTLLEKLFGKQLYHTFYSTDPMASDEPEVEPPKAPQQPPSNEPGPTPPDQPDQPIPPMPGQQPQLPAQIPGPGLPANPMPLQPPGFKMGMY